MAAPQPPAVLITGASSGIGRAAALLFAERGWQVAATLRQPEQAQELASHPLIRLYRLDVTDAHSIRLAFAAALADLGRLDAVVNNAGYGLDGAFEAMDEEAIRRQFDTNVLGLMRVTQEAIRHFRAQGGGCIVQVSSVGGRMAYPFYSVYHSSKWAVEGFSESLAYELRPLGIRVKVVEPGPVRTDFFHRSRQFAGAGGLQAYEANVGRAVELQGIFERLAAPPESVAQTLFRAAVSRSGRLRYASDVIGAAFLLLRRLLPPALYRFIVRSAYRL
jgi:NAD(P)-dependent dehydrogenase (short-subunit alcohol dehydrogenase family)